jgi:hypothetical protein
MPRGAPQDPRSLPGQGGRRARMLAGDNWGETEEVHATSGTLPIRTIAEIPAAFREENEL